MRILFDKLEGYRPYYIEIEPEWDNDTLFQFSFSEYFMYENLDRYYISLDNEFQIIVDIDDNSVAVINLDNQQFLFEVETSPQLVERILNEFETGFTQFVEYTDHNDFENGNGNRNGNNYGAALRGLYMNEIPKNAENAIMGNKIEEGNRMVNFHNERNFGRFYKESTLNALPQKKNPFTKKNIRNSNIVRYVAHVKKRKSRRTRKARKTRKYHN